MTMSDDEEEDLWGDLEEMPSNVAMSANLLAMTDAPGKKVTFEQPDEKSIPWVAPSFSGLDNSNVCGTKGSWYREEASLMKTPLASATKPATAIRGSHAGSQVALAATSSTMTPPAPAETPNAPAAALLTALTTAPSGLPKAGLEAAPSVMFSVMFSLPTTAAGGIDWGAMGSPAVKASS
jgi:hypothetical protein